MADFNRKKLQVFVSSTFSDLRDERQAAVEAILSAGHIPAGMELFTAGDESQMEVIKQWIDESDVYMLILGARYGSIEPKSGKSYTQLEYEYALNQGKPLFACVMKEEITDKRVTAKGKEILELENPQKFKEFRNQVLTKMCKFWEDCKDVKIAIVESLSLLARRDNLVGWVRPNTQSNLPVLADEIARLSHENAELRRQLVAIKKQPEEMFNGLTFQQMAHLLNKDGTLDYFLKAASDLAVGIYVGAYAGEMELKKLALRGVVESQGAGKYRLSATGRALLNTLDIFEPNSEAK